jgi:hypothetical protein
MRKFSVGAGAVTAVALWAGVAGAQMDGGANPVHGGGRSPEATGSTGAVGPMTGRGQGSRAGVR